MTFLNITAMSFLLMVSGVFWRNPQTSSWFGVAAGRGLSCGAMFPLCRKKLYALYIFGGCDRFFYCITYNGVHKVEAAF